MAAPIANFSFIPNPSNPLEITFQGLPSSNGEPIISWLWDFGDTNTSTNQVQTHTYTTPGIFLISLTVTNADGSDIIINYIVITNTPNIIDSIITMVECKVPPAFRDLPCIYDYIRKWQLYLQPQVNTIPIPDSDVFIESSWPPLFNVLIAELTVYEVIMARLAAFTIAGNVSGNGSTTNSTITNPGSLKKLETGPSNAEWYQNTFQDLTAQSQFARVVFNKNDGMINQYKQSICMLANRLFVKLDICEYTRKENRLFKKSSVRDNEPIPSYFRPWTL